MLGLALLKTNVEDDQLRPPRPPPYHAPNQPQRSHHTMLGLALLNTTVEHDQLRSLRSAPFPPQQAPQARPTLALCFQTPYILCQATDARNARVHREV